MEQTDIHNNEPADLAQLSEDLSEVMFGIFPRDHQREDPLRKRDENMGHCIEH